MFMLQALLLFKYKYDEFEYALHFIVLKYCCSPNISYIIWSNNCDSISYLYLL